MTVRLYFFLPCREAEFGRLPTSLRDYQAWQRAETDLTPFLGRYHWVLQTYLHLREVGARVELVRELPDEGIVISHVECLEYGMRPTPKMMFVPMLVDKDVPVPHAALHVTHNPAQRLPLGLRQHYMPPWPQIGLVPRPAMRGLRFESVAFMGYRNNLDAELTSDGFARRLAALGLRLVTPEPSEWHDFSGIDAVVAVRNFGQHEKHLTKPALKLHNAWLAGVPAVLGYETAYRREGRAGVDYLEAQDSDAVLAALHRLLLDTDLRTRLIAAGTQRLRTDTELRALWLRFIAEDLLPLYAKWSRDRWFRGRHLMYGAVRERLLWRRPAWFSEMP